MLFFCACSIHRCRCGRSSPRPLHEGWYSRDGEWQCDSCQRWAENWLIVSVAAVIVLGLFVCGRVFGSRVPEGRAMHQPVEIHEEPEPLELPLPAWAQPGMEEVTG